MRGFEERDIHIGGSCKLPLFVTTSRRLAVAEREFLRLLTVVLKNLL